MVASASSLRCADVLHALLSHSGIGTATARAVRAMRCSQMPASAVARSKTSGPRAKVNWAATAGTKRPRAPAMARDESDSDYDNDSSSDEDDEDGDLEPEIRAGGRVRRRIDSDDEDEGGGGAKRRCQEGAAEARGSLGGGGKRGWLA